MLLARNMLKWIVYTALALVLFVAVVGGIVCVTDDAYTFAAYLEDMSGIYRLLAVAIFGVLAQALLPVIERAGRNGR